MLLGFSTGSFGGGLGNSVDGSGGRYDLDALMMWEVRNLGLGEQAARRERNAQVQQARFNTVRVLDQVAQEITEAAAQVEFRRQQLSILQTAIKTAEQSYRYNWNAFRKLKVYRSKPCSPFKQSKARSGRTCGPSPITTRLN